MMKSIAVAIAFFFAMPSLPSVAQPRYGGLNRSTQHFILEGKDGVWDGTEIS